MMKMIPGSRYMTILVIDDDEMNRKIAEMILSRKTMYKVVTAVSGVSGLEILHNEKIDLVLLDVDMPVMDGFQTLDYMRLQMDMRDIPVILLTASADRSTVLRANEYGIREYLRKPFTPDELVERVTRVAGKAK